jgi:thiol-disulfide isomerase/thioredoxin
MKPAARSAWIALLVFGLSGPGCNDVTTHTTDITKTPAQVLQPQAPEEAQSESPQTAATKTKPIDIGDRIGSATKQAGSATIARPDNEGAKATEAPRGDVDLIAVKYDEMLKRIADKKAKLTMVDAWATWCAPCKENFPHVVQMHRKYADQGLAVVSLSLDDPSQPQARAEALKFLQRQKATFTNFLLDEEPEKGFELLNVNAIPAVFLFGPDGQEIKRFTWDDPNHQFTYDDVEKTVAAMLKGAAAVK